MENFKDFWTKEEWDLFKDLANHRPLQKEDPHHVTTSAFVINPSRDKVLFIYHKKYDSWSWMGGHLEPGETLYQCALRELKEESGIEKIEKTYEEPISLEKLWAKDHYHYNTTFLFVVSEEEELHENKKETKGIQWIPIKDLENYVSEDYMMPYYQKILQRIFPIKK
ncbi:MAG: NUDIX domain-containing protein [Tissierellia bacterium]|nr:NUDIX domain-containing protein [Tissierellia bacterium]